MEESWAEEAKHRNSLQGILCIESVKQAAEIYRKKLREQGFFSLKRIWFPNCEILACLLIDENVCEGKNQFKVEKSLDSFHRSKIDL